MSDENYIRSVQTSVNNFIHCGDEYLFLKRNNTKKIDPGRLNSIGGRVEHGEDHITACIRETEEETGYKITPEHIKLSGIGRLQGGYREDWIICIFKTEVETKDIPIGSQTDDGELIWIHKDKVLDSEYELVDDLNYIFKDIVEGELFCFSAEMDDQQKVANINISKLKTAL